MTAPPTSGCSTCLIGMAASVLKHWTGLGPGATTLVDLILWAGPINRAMAFSLRTIISGKIASGIQISTDQNDLFLALWPIFIFRMRNKMFWENTSSKSPFFTRITIGCICSGHFDFLKMHFPRVIIFLKNIVGKNMTTAISTRNSLKIQFMHPIPKENPPPKKDTPLMKI